MVQLLVGYADLMGYRLTYGEAYRLPGSSHGHSRSLHYDRLAVDFNVFTQNAAGSWRYQSATSAHRELGKFWEMLGGSWGGDYNDGNHYSLSHDGRR